MTEKEARQKWCPMAQSRAVLYWKTETQQKQARWLDDAGEVRLACIASACALWVSATAWDDVPIDQRHGHCGLIRG